MIIPTVRRTTFNVQSLFLAVLPHGGQGSARRNAWGCMSEGATRARGRREADLAMNQAIARSEAMAQHPAGRQGAR